MIIALKDLNVKSSTTLVPPIGDGTKVYIHMCVEYNGEVIYGHLSKDMEHVDTEPLGMANDHLAFVDSEIAVGLLLALNW